MFWNWIWISKEQQIWKKKRNSQVIVARGDKNIEIKYSEEYSKRIKQDWAFLSKIIAFEIYGDDIKVRLVRLDWAFDKTFFIHIWHLEENSRLDVLEYLRALATKHINKATEKLLWQKPLVANIEW